MRDRSPRNLNRIWQEVDVLSYVDYRSYLMDLYGKAKSGISGYSYLIFAEDLGFSGTNVMRLVVQGKRRLSLKSAEVVASKLRLRSQKRRYFMAMVNHALARSPAKRERWFLAMLEAKKEALLTDRGRAQMEYYSEWYHPIVREVIRLMGGGFHEPEKISRTLHPDLSPKKIKQSIRLLESMGLVKLDENGWAQSNSDESIILPSDRTAGELTVFRYHEAMLELAKGALGKVPDDELEFNALTLALNKDQFSVLVDKLRTVCGEIMAMETETKDKDRVVQCNLQLFSVTKVGKP